MDVLDLPLLTDLEKREELLFTTAYQQGAMERHCLNFWVAHRTSMRTLWSGFSATINSLHGQHLKTKAKLK